MKSKPYPWAIALFLLILALAASPLLAQEPNPTPPVVYLTPTMAATETPTAVPSATPPSGGVQPDAWEPNDDPGAATPVSWGMVPATLHPGDVDYYALYLKTGQVVSLHTGSPHNLDTYLQVWQGAQLLVENDDRAATDLGSAVLFTVPAEGWYAVGIFQRGTAVGRYELYIELAEPTPTLTPAPTATSSPTPTPSPTLTPTPTATPTTLPTITPPFMGAAGTAGSTSHPSAPIAPGLAAAVLTPTPTVTTTAVLTAPITLRLLGPAQPAATPQVTTARVLIYYDANNNRQPEPGEGVASVSVLAVDGQGQQLTRSFTSPQGEAAFALTGAPFERVVTPFVSAWSARVRPGLVNEDIILGLPAVRLPVFLPVSESES